jgi:UrcA family protein
MNKSIARGAFGSVVLMLAGVTGTAIAQDASGAFTKVMTVHYSDLNLSTTAGATTLYNRILGAAHYVCGEEGYANGIDMQNYWNTCFQLAVNDAVAKVHSPLLTKVASKERAKAAPVTAMLSH